MIKTKHLLINLMLSLVAFFLHVYLTQKFFDLRSGAASGQSLCNLNSLWNCDAVSTSPFASLWGYPVALWALVVHIVFVAAQGMVLLRQSSRDLWAHVTVYGSFLIFAASIVMGFLSLTQLKVMCLFCFAAYGLSALNLIFLKLAGFEFKFSLQALPEVLKDKTAWGLVAFVPAAVFVFGSNWGGSTNDSRVQAMMNDAVAAWAAAPVINFDTSLGLHMGAPLDQAKMTIIEFADFRCPHCKFAAPSIKSFTQSRSDVALIFKTFPLDGTCNVDPVFQGQGDGISCYLSFAVMCAEKLNKKGWDLYSHIFEKQDNYQQLRSVADTQAALCEQKTLIPDCESFKTCTTDESTRLDVQKMAQEGTQAKIRGTPTFFVNGKLLNGGQQLPVLEKVEDFIKGQSN